MDEKPWDIAKSELVLSIPEMFSGVVFSLVDFNRGCFYNIRSNGFINVNHAELVHVNPTLLVFLYETNTERRKITLTPKTVCINDIRFERMKEDV